MGIDLDALEAAADAVRVCTSCPLHETRGHAVPGEGGGSGVGAADHFTSVMLVGEAPGRNEDETGRPFCGAAGKNLDLGLAAAGIERHDVFVTSIVKCRPPKNRDPRPAEKAACRPHLEAQLAALRPNVLVALGRHGLSSLVERPPKAFSEVRGRFVAGPDGVPVFCSLHPAAIIYRQAWREDYLADWAWFGAWVRAGAKDADVPAERRTGSGRG